MILFSLLLTNIVFIRYFYYIDITRMGIVPIAILVALFFSTGISSNHKDGMSAYIEKNLQTFSRLLIGTGIQIIFSLFHISWLESSVILITLNAFLLYFTYIQTNKERQWALRAWVFFQSIIFILASLYSAYLQNSIELFLSLIGMLIALLSALQSFLYRIIGIFTPLHKYSYIPYELFAILHLLLVITILKSYWYIGQSQWLIIIQIYIALLFYGLAFLKQHSTLEVSNNDLDVEYILRGYTINQLPSKTSQLSLLIKNKTLQNFIQYIPDWLTTLISVTSISITSILCALIIYYSANNILTVWDFWIFLFNTWLYLLIFYYCKKMGIHDKLWRVAGLVMINICFYVAIAHIFEKDTASVLFWSILRTVLNNTAMNYFQELKNYLDSNDYTYRLFSNFLGLLIVLYFFLTLSLDILLKFAIVIMIIGLRMLMNKDNLKSVFQKE